jgi:uncharacterized protein (TIGR02246 family)
MIKILIFVTLIFLIINSIKAKKCNPITETEVKALWKKWNAALQTLDPEKVAELYHADSILIPTLSNEVRADNQTKINYFVEFLAKKPVGTIKEDYVNVVSKDTALYNGIYTFEFTPAAKSDARFTYVYNCENGEWKIKTHHSSLMPEKKPGIPETDSNKKVIECGDKEKK